MYCARPWNENNMYRGKRSFDILLLILPYNYRIFMTRVFYAHIFSQYRNSCASNMCHILLAGYENVPSFLNQWKLYGTSRLKRLK